MLDFLKGKKTSSFSQKIFCVGLNKTGTTSVEKALLDFGYKMGHQNTAELLLDDWIKRDFTRIIEYCKSADAFQDAPFSFPYTFAHLDMAFPNSKFILTIRDDAEQWYRSLTKFHGKLWNERGDIPTMEDLKKATYLHEGYPYKAVKHLFSTDDNDLYNKEKLIDYYNTHNKNVINYFKYCPEKLLVLNLSDKSSYENLCIFLGIPPLQREFPWENKT